MQRAWNAGWYYRPGPAEPVFLSEEWAGPDAVAGAAKTTDRGMTTTTGAAMAAGAATQDSPVGLPAAGWIPVHLPHDMIGAPLNSFDERTFARKGCYAKLLTMEQLARAWSDVDEASPDKKENLGQEAAPSEKDGAQPGAVPVPTPDKEDDFSPSSAHRSGAPAIFLRFEGVSVSCRVWVNGRLAGSHTGPYTPFEVRIDPHLKLEPEAPPSDRPAVPGAQPSARHNVRPAWILVEVDSSEDAGAPPFGGVVDYLVFGGIYRGVSLEVHTGAWVGTVWCAPRPLGDMLEGQWIAEVKVQIEAAEQLPPQAKIRAQLFSGNDLIIEESAPVESPAGHAATKAKEVLLSLAVNKPRLWDIDDPFLYRLEVALLDESGRAVDMQEIRTAFRTAEFGPSGFYLNHRRVFLRGLNRHQEYPYAGYAMGPDAQRRDAEMLKQELGCIIVRTSHYPQSPYFLDACDELGLLVFEELPGWQHVGDASWQEHALRDLRDMILRDRNHPSIVLWGVRVNESQDNHDFYTRTNALARELDPFRPTAGVRYIAHSELLEDVYTFNDFIYDGEGTPFISEPAKVLPKHHKKAPYLITEHTGHMFPTKSFDQEERLVAHSLRHAHILDTAMGNPRIAGCIGWCAFDYHTHKDFGSGDRICYHGVADMFRIPKYAGFLYASQVSPSERLVLEPASHFAKGERDAARMLPVYVFTNCDAIDVYRGASLVGRFFPDKTHFANLPHPPVVIDDLIGKRIEAEGWPGRDAALFCKLASKAMAAGASRLSLMEKLQMGLFMHRRKLSMRQIEELVIRYGMGWGSADESIRLVGILNGKEVAERTFGADSTAQGLVAEADSNQLCAVSEEEWSSTRIVVRAVDQYGNTTPFVFEPFSIETEGPISLTGPSLRALAGGASAFWVAAGGLKGHARIIVSSPRFESPALVELEIV